jgi:hypothetical protein
MLHSRRHLLVAAAAALALAGTAVVASSASAAPAYDNCGGTCYGKDPYATGCANSAYIANSVGLFDAAGRRMMTIENWYSTGCGTNWGLAYIYDVSASDIQADRLNPPFQFTCFPATPGTEECGAYYTGTASPMWTDMVFGADTKVSVCGYGYDKERPFPNGPRYSACADA